MLPVVGVGLEGKPISSELCTCSRGNPPTPRLEGEAQQMWGGAGVRAQPQARAGPPPATEFLLSDEEVQPQYISGPSGVVGGMSWEDNTWDVKGAWALGSGGHTGQFLIRKWGQCWVPRRAVVRITHNAGQICPRGPSANE